jgi:hypothetical protein
MAHCALCNQWPIDSGLQELGLDFWAQDHLHDIHHREEAILCSLAKGFLHLVSDILVIQCRQPGLAMLMTQQLSCANKPDHPLSD